MLSILILLCNRSLEPPYPAKLKLYTHPSSPHSPSLSPQQPPFFLRVYLPQILRKSGLTQHLSCPATGPSQPAQHPQGPSMLQQAALWFFTKPGERITSKMTKMWTFVNLESNIWMFAMFFSILFCIFLSFKEEERQEYFIKWGLSCREKRIELTTK